MEIFGNFGIQPVLLAAQIVNFLIILYLLKRFFYKPIVKILEDRKKRIEESLKNAQLIEEKLQQTETKTNQILQETQNNAQGIIDAARKEAERIADEAAIQAKKTQEETLAKTKVQIASLHAQMQKQLEKETLILVVEVVRKVLGRTLKPKERETLTSKAISQITKQIQ